MKKENSLVSQQDKSKSNTRIYDNDSLKGSLIICFARLNIDPPSVDYLVQEIRGCYPNVKTTDITSAIKNGAMGMYGRTYKFSFQEVSIWIMEYRKSNNNSYLFKG